MEIKEKEMFDSMLTFANGRKRLIELATVKHPDNWQDVATPYDICGEMVDLVKHDGAYYIVFFSLEFLEVMIHEKGIEADSILFVTDYEIEGSMAGKMYDVEAIVVRKNDLIIDGKFDFGVAKEKVCGNIAEKLEGNSMKFSKVAVVGNPPYQINDGGGKGSSAKPLYHLFVEAIIDGICPDYFTFIIPSRWMVGGRGLDSHRERMMNDTRMKKIVHFSGENTVFDTVRIQGGVNYFLWEKDYSGSCEFVDDKSSITRRLNEYDIILQDNNAAGILAKVAKHLNNNIGQTAFSQKPFGLRSDFSDFTDSGITCYTKDGKNIIKMLCDPNSCTDKFNIIKKYKVCISKTNDDSNPTGPHRITTEPSIFEPNSVSTETFLVLHTFPDKLNAENFQLYVKTKFFRFMVSLRKTSHNLSRDVFSWVPDLQDYSTPWTDSELYKKFGLTRQEIAYIESKIKEIK